MKKVVVNASPLIFLAKISQLNLLSDFDVHVPRQVFQEVIEGKRRGKEEAKELVRFLEGSDVRIVDCRIKAELPGTLGEGEKAVISYAVEHGIRDVWLDEAKARSVARIHKLAPQGTIGILWEGYRKGQLSGEKLEQNLFELVKKGYRIREEILIKVLEAIREQGS